MDIRNYYLTARSGNIKTGPIAVTTADARNCPAACPLRGAGCYAEHGKLKLFWDKVTAGGTQRSGVVTLHSQTFAEHVAALREVRAPMVRLHQAGDLPGAADALDAAQCMRLAGAAATGGRVAWTYTHYPVDLSAREWWRLRGRKAARQITRHNVAVVRAMIDAGTVVNISGNSVVDAVKKRRAHGLPTVAVVPRTFKPGRYGAHGRLAKSGERFAICPAQTSDKVTCATCGNGSPLCARADRDYIVAFRAHGAGATAAEGAAA